MNVIETVTERERRIMQAIDDRQHGIDTPDVSFKNRVVDARKPDLNKRERNKKNKDESFSSEPGT